MPELSIAILGIELILFAIPDLLNLMVGQVYFKNNPEEFGIPRDKTSIFYNTFQLAVGTFIILNARNYAKKVIKGGKQDDRQDEGTKI